MKKVLCLLIVATLSLAVVFAVPTKTVYAEELVDSGIDYSESLDVLSNPDRGMFYLYQIYVKDNATQGQVLQGSKVSGRLTAPDFEKFLDGSYDYPEGTTTFVLSFGLEYFSKKAGGSDIELTQNALNYIKNTLAEAEKAGASVIVRFCYDLLGKTYDTKSDCEPSMDLMLKHIEQLGPILTQYNGIITAVQSGMFGPWGEQHTTSVSDYNNANNYYKMIDKWLSVTPSDMWILVRRTRFFVHWYNVKYSKSYTTSNINQIVCKEGTPEYRIGCYNDGYLADKTDWDTYVNRTAEVAWLESQTYAPYGGEVCSDASGLNSYNKISYLEVEAFKTHTSFLNYLWDYDKVIKNWEKETYNGKDSVYKGKTSSFTYVLNHLGYRLVLKESKLSKTVDKGGSLTVTGKVENVGFGNIPRQQNAYLVIEDANKNEVYSALTSIDAQSFLSTKTVAYSATISLNSSLSVGEYKVYLRLSGKNQSGNSLRYISFANKNIYNENLNANYLGSFKIVAGQNNSSQSNSSTVDSSKNSSSSKDQSSKNSSVSSAVETSKNDSSSKDQSPEIQSSSKDQSSQDKNSKENSSSVKSVDKKSSQTENEPSKVITRPGRSSAGGGGDGETKSGCSSEIDGQNTALFMLALTAFCIVLFKKKKKE